MRRVSRSPTERDSTIVTLDQLLSSAKLVEEPVLTPVLVVVGARCAGKDTELTRLRQLRTEDVTRYGDYFKVQYWVPKGKRVDRTDEEIAREAGAIEKSIDELTDPNVRYLFCYKRGETFYGFVPEEIKKPGIPMIHVADVSGLTALKNSRKLSNHLLVLININGTTSQNGEHKQHLVDIRERALTRLTREYNLTRDDILSTHNSLLEENVKEILKLNKQFMLRKEEYDAIYNNKDPSQEGIRSIIYPNARESVIEDIAYRINELFHRYVDVLKARQHKPVYISVLHNNYVRDVCRKIFEKGLGELAPRDKLNSQLHRCVREYAENISSVAVLDEGILSTYLAKTSVSKVCKDKPKGTYTVHMCSQMDKPLSLQTLRDQGSAIPHADFHIMRIIAYELFKNSDNIRTRPEYVLDKDNNILGITYSLSDHQPRKDSKKQVYSSITITFDY